MRKKILLYLICLAIIGGAFWLYHGWVGSDKGWHNAFKKHIYAPVAVGQGASHVRVESRGVTGRLQYVLEAHSAKPMGHGRYFLRQPRVFWYTRSLQVITISSDVGNVRIDQMGKFNGKIFPRGGTLTGHVKVTVSRVHLTRGFQDRSGRHAGKKRTRRGPEITAVLATPLHFSYQQRLLTSKGLVHVYGPRVDFVGTGLTAAFNIEKKRLDYLRIDHGEHIVVHGIGGADLGGTGLARRPGAAAVPTARLAAPLAVKAVTPGAAAPSAKGPAGRATVAQQVASAKGGVGPGKILVGKTGKVPAGIPAAPKQMAAAKAVPTIYQLTFFRQVRASWQKQTLHAAQMRVVFEVAGHGSAATAVTPASGKAAAGPAAAAGHKSSATGTAPAPTPAPTGAPGKAAKKNLNGTPIVAKAPASNPFLAPANGQPPGHTLAILWHGQMTMRPIAPARAHLATPHDLVFTARAARHGLHRQITLADAQFRRIRANRLWFDNASQVLKLKASGLRPVEMYGPNLGRITCRGVTLAQSTGVLTLAGPGEANVAGRALRTAKKPRRIKPGVKGIPAPGGGSGARPTHPAHARPTGRPQVKISPAALIAIVRPGKKPREHAGLIHASKKGSHAPAPQPDARLAKKAVVVAFGSAHGGYTARWSNRLTLKFTRRPDPKRPGKKIMEVRQAHLRGAALVRSGLFSLRSGDLLAVFAADKTAGRPQLRRLIARRRVRIRSWKRVPPRQLGPGAGHKTLIKYKPQHAHAPASALHHSVKQNRTQLAFGKVQLKKRADNAAVHGKTAAPPAPRRVLASTLSCGWLEVRTAAGKHGRRIRQVVARRNVVAASWRNGRKRQSLRADKLVASLRPRKAKLQRSHHGRPVPKTSVTSAAFHVGRVRATGHVRMTLAGRGKPVRVRCDALIANRTRSRALLEGRHGVAHWAKISQGKDYLTGRHIRLWQKKQQAQIRGRGTLVFLAPATQKNAKPGLPRVRRHNAPRQPVAVTWRHGLKFDGPKNRVIITGHVRAKSVGNPLQTSSLHAASLTVFFRRKGVIKKHRQGGDSRKSGAQALGGGGRYELARLVAAHGKNLVVATGAQYAPGGKLLSRFLVRGRQLRYNDSRHRLKIPGAGAMFLEDYRPTGPMAKHGGKKHSSGVATKGKQKPTSTGKMRGQVAFSWEKSLVYRAKTNAVDLTGRVKMVYKPTKPLLAGQHRSVRKVAAGSRGRYVRLACRVLHVMFRTTRAAVSDPAALGSAGHMRLARVRANDAALALLGIKLIAPRLSFRARTDMAMARSLGRQPAAVVGADGKGYGQADRIMWSLKKGRNGLTFIHPRGLVSTP